MKLFLTIISLLLFFIETLDAQKNLYLEGKTFVGRVVPHHLEMKSLVKSFSYGAEINYLIQNKSENVFTKKYNFPKLGIGLSAQSFGNPDDLGNSYSGFLFGDFAFNDFCGMRLYSGLSYLTKKYDKINNPENIAIGSHLNYYFNLGFLFNVNFENSKLIVSPGMIHNSNGSVLKPNLGLNQLYLSVAYLNNFANKNKDTKIYFPQNLSKSEFWAMATLTSSDEYTRIPESRGGGFICSTVAAGYNYRYSAIGKLGVSADCFYNSNLQYYFDTNGDTLIISYPETKDVIRCGLSFGHQLIYSRLELVSFVGFYFYNKIKPYDHFYTRVGIRYYVCDYFFVNLTLKAIGFKAQYIESGIGFSFRRKLKK